MLETLREALTPFLWGGALALFLNLPLRWLEGHLGRLPARWRRGAALGLLLTALAAGLALGAWLLAPQLWAAVTQLAAALPGLFDRVGGAVARSQLGSAGGRALLLRGLQGADAAGESALAGALSTGVDTLVTAAAKVGDLVVALVLAVYLLADKEGLARKAVRLTQAALGRPRADRAVALARRAGQIFSRFVAGQCIEAVILAGLFVVVLFGFGFPNVLPIAAVIGVTALVPVFGAFAGCAVGVVLVLPYGVEKAGWFVLLFLCVQQLENNLIYPHVVGGRIGLPPLWVLAAVVLGGGLFGVAGLVLGIPAVSVVYHLGGDWVRARLGEGAEQAAPPAGESAPGRPPGA